jgi:5-methylcytosine-specific restriction endonuclease McrA
MVPLSRGGTNDISNIVLACANCNLKKHTKTHAEFIKILGGG